MKKIILSMMLMLGGLMLMSQNTYADDTINLDTARLRGLVKLYGASDYGWTQELRYNEVVPGVRYARAWDFYTAPFLSTGTNMVVTFTTEIAYTDHAPFQVPWVNKDNMHVLYCFWGNDRIEIVNENLVYAGSTNTYPVPNSDIVRNTSKWIANVALKGIPKNTTERLKCASGSYDYAYYDAVDVNSAYDGEYSFVSNAGQITMTDNSTEILMQQQIAQTQQLIDINAQIAQQIAQNQIKIDQLNQQIVQTQQNIQDIEDTLTNSNITGDFNLGPFQSYGPISGIVTEILGIPMILANINACQPVTPNLPYINEEITIPCMRPILNNMAGGFIIWVDVILTSYIYYKLAVYIFKKVQDLRNPENDDEEYLDL